MAASVWISPVRFSVWPLSFWAVSDLFSAEMMPSVTVGPPARARALPMAKTESPTWAWSELPKVTVGRSEAWSICTRARSSSGSVPTTWAARALVWPNRVTVTVVAPATTWLLVRISPVGVRIIPLPAASTKSPPTEPPLEPESLLIETTAGSTLASTSWTSPGLASTLRLGKNFSTSVCWLFEPTTAPTRPPTSAATTAVIPTTHIQVPRWSVCRTARGAGSP